MNRKLCAVAAVMACVIIFAGCGGTEGFDASGNPIPAQPDYQRTPPELNLAQYVGLNQQTRTEARDAGQYSALIDVTNSSDGYVAASCTAPVGAVLQVIKGDASSSDLDTYTLANDGSMNFFPLTKGDGRYNIRLFLHQEGNAYEPFMTYEVDVTLESEFAPFLVQNAEVNYDEDSQCVDLSYEITKHCSTDLEVVQAVCAWITDNITYDTSKALQLAQSSGYVPNPDATLAAKSGICYDYASLAAAMLRANGIPTKLVKGDVLNAEGEIVYHAWNAVWLKETGWIAIGVPSSPNSWSRMDTTLAAGGTDPSFIADGSNYMDISVH